VVDAAEGSPFLLSNQFELGILIARPSARLAIGIEDRTASRDTTRFKVGIDSRFVSSLGFCIVVEETEVGFCQEELQFSLRIEVNRSRGTHNRRTEIRTLLVVVGCCLTRTRDFAFLCACVSSRSEANIQTWV